MTTRFEFVTALAMLTSAAAIAAPATFAFVNATGNDISAMEARKTGSSGWSAVPYSARTGASGPASFDIEDCAWDVRVTFAGGETLTYSNLNLCEAKLVTLRRKDGIAWVDYD